MKDIKDKEFRELYKLASKLSGKKELSEVFKYKHVGCALISSKGNIFTGISIKAPSATGMCAEQAAVMEMLKNDEVIIKKIISVRDGNIVSPCGKCREFIRQVANESTLIMVSEDKILGINDLLPYAWDYHK